MFLTDNDYKTLINDDDLAVIQKADTDIRAKAEAAAQEEISGYLRNRYDVDSIFDEAGDDRNPVIIIKMIDIVLYHLSASLPARLGMETRQLRYDETIKWLDKVNKGLINPGLPYKDADDSGNPIKFSSQTKTSYQW